MRTAFLCLTFPLLTLAADFADPAPPTVTALKPIDPPPFQPQPELKFLAASLVFTYGAEGKLHALDLKTGQLLWKRELLPEFKVDPNFFGVGATPLVEKDLLIINVGA